MVDDVNQVLEAFVHVMILISDLRRLPVRVSLRAGVADRTRGHRYASATRWQHASGHDHQQAGDAQGSVWPAAIRSAARFRWCEFLQSEEDLGRVSKSTGSGIQGSR